MLGVFARNRYDDDHHSRNVINVFDFNHFEYYINEIAHNLVHRAVKDTVILVFTAF